jgi:hypothetical protein
VIADVEQRQVGSQIDIQVNPAGHGEVYIVERELPGRMIA